MKKKVAVLIPIYKEKINHNELISLNQCIKILYKYPILFFGPKSLDTTFYEHFCRGKIDFSFENFEDNYFGDIAGYNRLMLSASFYKQFLNYKFILIYQLDAFVFKDELLLWCDKNYDFIGAPHPSSLNKPDEIRFLKGYGNIINSINKIFKSNHQISNVGNGGFSLRKTSTFIILLWLLKNKIKKWGVNNEDGFFKYWGNIFYPFFKLPTDKEALKFSIETAPEKSFELLCNELPFGCHAFEKNEPEFWKKFISTEINAK